jgi:hypothetical protein
MKTLILAVAALLASQMLAEPVEFVGYITIGSDRHFILYDAKTKESSLWMKLGQEWHGYTPASFDAKKENLTVKSSASDLVLCLRDSKVRAVQSVMAPGMGSYKLVDGTMVYGPDAKLRLRNDLISSPSGLMVSDIEQTIVAGDLLIERPDGSVIKVANGVVTSKDGATSIRGQSMEILVPPATSATAPAAREAHQP